jgi:hypothetical protein
MGKRMVSRDAIRAYVSDKGYVCLMQEKSWDEEEGVVLEPEQVVVAIQWLQECLPEARARFSQFEDDADGADDAGEAHDEGDEGEARGSSPTPAPPSGA